ncbi:MAG: hypothetical protein ABIR70_16505 [Bryobacteraceae bacterium]
MEPTLVDTSPFLTAHPSADILESYALGLLPQNQLAPVENHLFICHECQDALAATDDYVAAMKSALAEPIPAPAPSRWAAFAGAFRFSRPVPAFAVALAALSLSAILIQTYNPNLATKEAEVTLRSVRGGSANVEALGPANSWLTLKIESQHLRVDESFGARIVDASGKQQWEGTPQFSQDNGYVLHVEKALGAGTYWVRLYDPQRQLLQEYGLKLE